MKRKAIVFLWMSISCLLAFTVLSLGYAESEISSADSASVFFSVIDEFRAAIHDPHYDSNFKDSFFSYEWRDYVDNPQSEPAYALIDVDNQEMMQATAEDPADVFKKVDAAARKNQMQRSASRVIRFPKTGS